MFRIGLIIFMLVTTLFSQEYTFTKQEYLIMDLGKRIKSVKVSDHDILYVEYNKEAKRAFTELLVYGKDYGRAYIFVTYADGDSESIKVHVRHDLNRVKTVLQNQNETVSLEEYDKNKFILKGDFLNDKEKKKTLDILHKADINNSKDLIDISTVENFPSIVKIKMYIVEMSNQSLDEVKSNLILEDIVGDNTMQINTIADQSLTLDGMFTSAIKHIGSSFSITHALKVLKQKQLAKILDESTLFVMEGENTQFLSGGTVYVRVQGTTSEGQPISDLKELEYGIKLDIKLDRLNSRNKTMLLSIDTQRTSINWEQKVDNIPGFGKKSIKTRMAARDGQIIVLSGLVSSEDSKIIKKVPLLGDIPILGKLFRSESFKKGKSELMFFLIPEIQES